MKFELTEPQIEKLNLWLDKIKNKHGKHGFITYSFTHDGIGLYVFVNTSVSKIARLDLTEYENF